MVPKDTQKSNHCCLRVSTHKSLAPQLCHRLHTAKPTRWSWLGWPAPRMHGTLRVVRRPHDAPGRAIHGSLMQPPTLCGVPGSDQGTLGLPDDICRSFSSTSSSGSMASQGRPKLLHCRFQGPTCRARCQRSTRTTGEKETVRTCPSFPLPVAYVHWTIVHLGTYLYRTTPPPRIDSFPRYMTRCRLKQGKRVTTGIAIAFVSASSLVIDGDAPLTCRYWRFTGLSN